MQQRRLNKLQENFLSAIKGERSKDFMDSILPIGSLDKQDCINIYAKGYTARLTEALGETFEATWWVLGDDDFLALCADFISITPSFYFDLSEYGFDFPAFLKLQPQIQEIPFLDDLASFEWAFNTIFHSPNFNFDNQKLLATLSEGVDFKLTLSKSAFLFESEFPVYEIWKERARPVDSLSHLDFSTHEKLLLYKRNSQVFIRSLTDNEFLVLKTISAEHSLEKSLDAITGTLGDISPERIRELFAFIAEVGVFEIVDK
jgi:hypothetical protein